MSSSTHRSSPSCLTRTLALALTLTLTLTLALALTVTLSLTLALTLALTPDPNPNPNNSNPNKVLRASCHIPVLGGLLPFRIGTAEGEEAEAHPQQGAKGSKGKGARYYDGLFWPSVLWSWRAFNASDTLLKASGLGYPNPDPNPYPNPCPNPYPNPNPNPYPYPNPYPDPNPNMLTLTLPRTR